MKRIAHLIEDQCPDLKQVIFLLTLLLLSGTNLTAQEAADSEQDLRPVRNMFESIWLIDNQTAIVPFKGTFEFDIQHRFGTWENGYDDFFGVFASSNIRMGLDYVPIDKLQLGFGFSKERKLLDFHAKYAILQQARKGGAPVNLTYLVNMSIDPRDKAKIGVNETIDRFAFFHQLMLARKFTKKLSLQAAGSISYFNFPDAPTDDEGNKLAKNDNMVVSASFLGRLKLTNSLGLIANFDVPFANFEYVDPKPNISFGIEMNSSSHAFQIFVGNYRSLVPQYNHYYSLKQWSQLDIWGDGESQVLIGFNMTRLWNF